jgi:hypothetical protein
MFRINLIFNFSTSLISSLTVPTQPRFLLVICFLTHTPIFFLQNSKTCEHSVCREEPDHLERLYLAIRGYLEISRRCEVLNRRLQVVSEMMGILKDEQNQLHGSHRQCMQYYKTHATVSRRKTRMDRHMADRG